MSADPQLRQSATAPQALGEALYFDATDHKLFGWLHLPDPGKVPSIGLVICKPFGYEAICSHRSLRAFAEGAAAAGVPALRFDYLGTGDSAEIDPQTDQLAIWAQDVIAAVAELQRRTGVERVCLLGIRLGALLAVLTADQCTTVTSLILIAPVLNGRRYVRELRTTVLASALGADRAPSNGTADVEIAAPVPSALEVGGFPISAATLSALALIDLNARIPAVSEMLVIDGANQITSRSWAEQASRSGIRAQHCALSGLVEMIMTAPQFASVPTEMVAAMRDWLQQYPVGIAETAGATGRHRINAQGLHSPAMYLACTGLPDHGSLRERPVFLTSEALLFGIVTEPSQEERRHRAVILLNAGADYHIGASGMYVGLARHWAQLGYVVLRMDLGGLGDSATRPGRPNDEIFPPAALDDIRNAIEWMRNRYSVSEMTLAGVCSGAYHALQAAIAAVPVDRILMVNPENFFWNEGMTVRDMQMAELVRNPTVYRERMFSSAAWKKLTSGRVNIRYILKIYLYRALLAIESTLRDLARYLRIHLPRDLGWDLERIGKRGVRLVFVFARGEPGIELLTLLAGMSVKRLGARCRVHIIDSADHVFSKSGPRTILERILSDELCSPVERSGRRRIGLQTQPKTL